MHNISIISRNKFTGCLTVQHPTRLSKKYKQYMGSASTTNQNSTKLKIM